MMKHNFSAGPAILPRPVIEASAEALLNFKNSGLSLIEISHRSKDFVAVMEEARQRVKSLYHLNDDYEVLFLQGGASLQFCMVPYNLMKPEGQAAYLKTGAWATKALKEGKVFGDALAAGSSEDANFNYIPKDFSLDESLSYFHITTNNTIYGTEIHDLASLTSEARAKGIPVVADMSSDIFSRKLDMNLIDLAYAGAQKNTGPAGTTLVIVRKSILGQSGRNIPTLLNYQTHIDKGSMFNTPPVFAVYVSMLNLRWLEEQGGLAEIEKRNKAKSEHLYSEIDRNSLFEGTAAKVDRSRMNVTFILKDSGLESEFLQKAEQAGIVGIKGHRSVEGFRASIYNALPIDSVKVLTELMKEFELSHS